MHWLGAENICSEGLPILDCLPRGNLTALTAGILGSLYQIIQDYFVCTKFYKIQLSRKVDHLRVVLNHLLKEKTVLNLSMFMIISYNVCVEFYSVLYD